MSPGGGGDGVSRGFHGECGLWRMEKKNLK